MRYARILILAVLALSIVAGLVGCGETLRGIGRDASRVGRGIKTIFVE
ncbi:MAG: entericidin [Candidatus Omnitrophica bacterium]|nr:entericidin [Candidatus Omnitrophota bacterium]